MGIPYYFYVIARSYEGILLKKWKPSTPCDHFFLDFNGLMHPASYGYLSTVDPQKPPADIEKGILTAIWKELQDAIALVQPKQTVQVYIDGVAPIAKMVQQRKRRYMSIHRKKLLQLPTLWDSNAISPGTTFMSRVHASLKAHIRHAKVPFEYYLNTSDESGEGEHKLFERLKRLYANPEEIKIIHGMDADLIMLSLLSHVSNIYLLREDPKTNEPMYLDVNALRKGILMDLKRHYQWSLSDGIEKDLFSDNAKEVIETYVILCMLLGNDFIPHPISLPLKKGGLEKIMETAKDLWNDGLTLLDMNTHTIHWTFLGKLLEALSRNENEDVHQVIEEYVKKKAHYETEEDRWELYPILPEYKDPLASLLIHKVDFKKWRLFYYKHLFHTRLNDTKVILQSCDLYLQGILWTYHYYKGFSKEDRWFYPYNYSPTLRDLSNYLNSHVQRFETLQQHWKERTQPRYFCHPMTQLMCIFPKESVSCVPPKYRSLFDHPSIQHLYPSQYHLQTFMKTHLWECTPVLPPIDLETIEKIKV